MIKKDKKLHFIAGALIMFISMLIINLFNVHFKVNVDYRLGLFLVLAAAILKEFYDSFHPKKHSVEFLDFLFTIFGGLAIYLLINFSLIL